MSSSSLGDKVRIAESSILAKNETFKNELLEVTKWYQFYDGYDELSPDTAYGQVREMSEDLDYTPTREVRNLTKKLINKQARTMFGKIPTIRCTTTLLGDVSDEDSEAVELKSQNIDKMLREARFWSKTFKAFKDSTIAKRVLLLAVVNKQNKIDLKYYTMPEFDYTVNTVDNTKLDRVIIVQQDPSTVGKPAAEQLWNQHIYEMMPKASSTSKTFDPSGELLGEGKLKDEVMTCIYTYRMTDGNDQEMYLLQSEGTSTRVTRESAEVKSKEVTEAATGISDTVLINTTKSYDTGLSEIPAYVILNDGLTGDIQGNSDIKDLKLMQDNYNKTNSDFQDSLRFGMFEQPYFIDVTSDSIRDVKIAPNGYVDLKTEANALSLDNRVNQAKVGLLNRAFSFAPAVATYLSDLKKDMYEVMDQPTPEKLQDVPSAKAIKLLYFDLQARCDDKWKSWESAISWAINFATDYLGTLKSHAVYEPDFLASCRTSTLIDITPNYNIPEDEETERKIGLLEVENNVRSHKSYMRKHKTTESPAREWSEVVNEFTELEKVTMGFSEQLNLDDDEGGTDNGEEDNKVPEEGNGESTKE